MRGAFVHALVELAAADPRIVLLTGDLGYMALEPFIERYPDRFFNVGVAEQNMIAIATGLAEAGYLPFAYSIVTFAALRPYEFIRNGPVAHHVPVRIVGVGAGFEYGTQGLTHHGIDDIGALRVLRGLTLIAPADHEQMRSALRATWNLPGPVYYRIGKDDRTTLAGLDGRFTLDDLITVRPGGDVAFVASGAIAAQAVEAADRLAADGTTAAVLIAPVLQPTPVNAIVAALRSRRLVITVEAHAISGGLGSMVAEVIAEHGLACRLVRCGVREPNHGVSGSQRFMEARHGLSPEALAETARRELARTAA